MASNDNKQAPQAPQAGRHVLVVLHETDGSTHTYIVGEKTAGLEDVIGWITHSGPTNMDGPAENEFARDVLRGGISLGHKQAMEVNPETQKIVRIVTGRLYNFGCRGGFVVVPK